MCCEKPSCCSVEQLALCDRVARPTLCGINCPAPCCSIRVLWAERKSEWTRRFAGGRRSTYIVGLGRRVGKVRTGDGRRRGASISSPSCERAASTGDCWGEPRRARTLVATFSTRGHQYPGPVAPQRSSRPGRRSWPKIIQRSLRRESKQSTLDEETCFKVSGFSRARTLDIEGLPHLAAPNT